MSLAVPCAAFLFLLQGANPLPGLLQWFPIAAILAIFYLLVFMPAQRRQKKTQEMLNALKSGDKVVTTGGLYGTIVGLENDAVQLRIAEQVKVKVARSAIAGVQPEGKEA